MDDHLAAHGKSEVLKIGTRMLGWADRLTRIMDDFAARYPHVALDYVPALIGQGAVNVERRRVDVGVILPRFEPPGEMNYLRIHMREALLVLPANHRLATLDRIPLTELRDETVITPPRGFDPSQHDLLLEWVFGNDLPWRIVESSDLSGERRIDQVAMGQGVTVTASAGLTMGEYPGVVFRRFEDPVPKLEYGFAWLDKARSAYVQYFVDLARERLESGQLSA